MIFPVGLVNISNWIKTSSNNSSSPSSPQARTVVDDRPSNNDELIKLQKDVNMLKVVESYTCTYTCTILISNLCIKLY